MSKMIIHKVPVLQMRALFKWPLAGENLWYVSFLYIFEMLMTLFINLIFVAYDDLISMLRKMVDKGLLKKENFDLLIIAETIEELYEKMKFFKPLPTPKWITKNQT